MIPLVLGLHDSREFVSRLEIDLYAEVLKLLVHLSILHDLFEGVNKYLHNSIIHAARTEHGYPAVHALWAAEIGDNGCIGYR